MKKVEMITIPKTTVICDKCGCVRVYYHVNGGTLKDAKENFPDSVFQRWDIDGDNAICPICKIKLKSEISR